MALVCTPEAATTSLTPPLEGPRHMAARPVPPPQVTCSQGYVGAVPYKMGRHSPIKSQQEMWVPCWLVIEV